MSQKLILPINKCKLTASWKTDAYKTKFGFTHYGADMVSTVGSVLIYASGDGEVVATGIDSVVGNVVAIKYTQAENRVTGKAQDVIFRYFHLGFIAVKKGDKVSRDKLIGNYGNTGSMLMAIHLHIETDTDTANPLFSPTVKSSSFLKGTAMGANDKTMTNPLEWLYCKADAPDSQTYTTTNDAYIRSEDKAVPQITGTSSPEISGLDKLSEENAELRQEIIALAAKNAELAAKLEKVKQAIA